jgi:hypothetical protein
MKSLLIDTIAMIFVATLLYLYLGTGLGAILVFVFGLIGIRQAKKYVTNQKSKQNIEPN